MLEMFFVPGLIVPVVPDSPDEVVEVLVEQPLQVPLHLHQRHLGREMRKR